MEDGEVRRSRNTATATATDSSSFFVLVSDTVHCGGQRRLFSSPRGSYCMLGLELRRWVPNFSISF
ncbi:uncharacterized protein G2W53_010090 [Senna tora]|uniref:Uncharacterized protein n=1 Tax=Senna tora TaxID=362788 RepID=A0A835CAY8_9FABA|nr:uncharacterized protein G2W53_010090 [Senna tora]